MMRFSAALVSLRKQQRLTQQDLADKISAYGYKVNTVQISRWENGRLVPSLEQFFLLCKVLNVRDALGEFSDFYVPQLNEEGQRKVREYTEDLIATGKYKVKAIEQRLRPLFLLPASAGTGQFLDGDDYEMKELDADVPDCVDFGIRIAGDSMEPKFHNGDIVWVKKQDTVASGEIGIFFLNGDAYIKQFQQVEDGIRLISLNAAYKPIEIGENSNFKVFGKVV